MRVMAFATLSLGLLGGYYAAMHAPEFQMHMQTLSRTEQLLVATVVILLVGIWILLLKMAFNVSLDRSSIDIGTQRGREAGARLKQRSIDPDDRLEALRQQVQTGDQRRELRMSLMIHIIAPYAILFFVGLVLLAMSVSSLSPFTGGF